MKRKEFFGLFGKGLIGGAAVLSGCSDLLNQDNPNNLTPGSFWQSADDANANVASVYQIFLGQNGGYNVLNWKDRLVPAMYRADDVGIRHDVPSYYTMALFTLTDTNGTVGLAWNMNYTGIFRANQVIENVPGITNMEEDERARLVGEAKFLRAFFYYNLLIKFWNIPLITTVPESRSDYEAAQATPQETWTQIEKDLTDAIGVLPTSYAAGNEARVTKGAAMGYLGKAQLFQQKWQDAANTFEQIINSNTYRLLPNFFDVFLEENDLNEESLLEVNYSGDTFKGQALRTPQNYEAAPQEAGGFYEYYPNQWLFDEMTKEKTTNSELDPRVYGTIIFPNDKKNYYGKSYEELFGSNATKLVWAKYSEWEFDHSLSQLSGKNERVLRYADVLLMHAEALTRLDNTTVAVPYINKVRNRANLGNMPSGASKQQVLKEIEHQRIIELAGEANRFYDLLRWGGNIDQSISIKENLTAHGAIGANNFQPGKHEYLPIPQSELQTNRKIKQNPGYSGS